MRKETKKETVERVTKKFIRMPDTKQNYIEGIMQGYMMAKEEEKDKQPA